MIEGKTGQITIIAKNISGKASGEIRDDAQTIKNETGGKFYQNGAEGVAHDKNEERKAVKEAVKPKTETTEVKTIKLVSALHKGSANDSSKPELLQDGMVYGKMYEFKVDQYTDGEPKDKSTIKWMITYDSPEYSKGKVVEIPYTVKGDRIKITMTEKDMCGRFVFVHAYINNAKSEGELKVWKHNRFRWFNRRIVEEEIKERTDNKKPWLVNQASTSLCGMACIFYLFAKEQPDAYKKFAKELFRTGEAKFNEYTVKPSIEILEKKMNTHHRALKTGDMPLIDYVTMAGTRNTDNPDYKGGDEQVQAINWPWVVNDLSKKLLGYKNIIDKGTKNFINGTTGLVNVENKLNELENLYKQNYKIILMVDSDLIQDKFDFESADYHWVVYEGGLNISTPNYRIKKYFEDLIIFDLFSWGSNPKDKNPLILNPKTKKLERNPEQGYLSKKISISHFNTNFYGYIACK
jgi:hypothetical protein